MYTHTSLKKIHTDSKDIIDHETEVKTQNTTVVLNLSQSYIHASLVEAQLLI